MPARPEGVEIRHPDGSSTPVELTYAGERDDGMHVWASASTVVPGDSVYVAVLPGRTAIAFEGVE